MKKWFQKIVCLGFFMASVCLGIAGDNEDKKSHAELAEDLYQNGWYQQYTLRDFTKAIKQYQIILKDHLNERLVAARSGLRLGECYEALGQKDRALDQYKDVLKRFSNQQNIVKEVEGKINSLGGSNDNQKNMVIKNEDTDLKTKNHNNLTETIIYIVALTAQGQTARLKFKPGDIIVKYNNKDVKNIRNLKEEIKKTISDQKIPIVIDRQNKLLTFYVAEGVIGLFFKEESGVVVEAFGKRNYKDLLLIQMVTDVNEKIEMLKEFVSRSNLSIIEQTSCIEILMSLSIEAKDRKEIFNKLMKNKTYDQVKEHLTARIGDLPVEEKDEIVKYIFDWKSHVFKGKKKKEKRFYVQYGLDTWDGRWKVNGGDGRNYRDKGEVYHFGGEILADDIFLGVRWFDSKDSDTLTGNYTFDKTNYFSNQNISERIKTLDVSLDFNDRWLPSINYRRIELSTKTNTGKREENIDLIMFGSFLDGIECEVDLFEEKDSKLTLGWRGNFSLGDLSLTGGAYQLNTATVLQYEFSKEAILTLEYNAEYFFYQGDGTQIENVQHGPRVGLVFPF